MSFYLRNLLDKLTPSARDCLDGAINFAVSQSHFEVDTAHLFYSFLKFNDRITNALFVDQRFKKKDILDKLEKRLLQMKVGNTNFPVFSESLTCLFEKAWLHASTKWSHNELDLPVLIAALINPDNMLLTESILSHFRSNQHFDDLLRCSCVHIDVNDAQVSASCEVLNKYTTNLTKKSINGEIEPILGRDNEIRQVIDILLRRKQNNTILIGEPGVGKTAIVEGLAVQIARGQVPSPLIDAEIRSLDLASLLAGASVKGEFEKRLQALLNEILCYHKPIVLFIDEAHGLIGAGGMEGQTDAANYLKPALARGELRVIAATTWKEYKKYVEKDGALTRRFQLIKVQEPDIETSAAILRSLIPVMSKHHNVMIKEDAITAAVNLSSRYITNKLLPDKAITLLDTACAHVSVSQAYIPKDIKNTQALIHYSETELEMLMKEQSNSKRQNQLSIRLKELKKSLSVLQSSWATQKNLAFRINQASSEKRRKKLRDRLTEVHNSTSPLVFECVDITCVANVVSEWTGIPLGTVLESEKQKLNQLFSRLQMRVIGQDHALLALTQQIKLCQAQLSSPGKPNGVYLFAGPSGVGKTETAHALSELIYGGKDNLITINMSEYQEPHSVAGLKGAPPGYVGYGQGGILTERVKHYPYSVVLLDEMEKAHPDIFEIFYQVFDKGFMMDAEGQLIDFKNTMVIMTSNLADSVIMDACNNGSDDIEELTGLIAPIFNDFFKPAFMGRVKLIPFTPLSKNEIILIIRLKLQGVLYRFEKNADNPPQLKYDESVVHWIAKMCKNQSSGAREIDSVLDKYILPLLADYLIHECCDSNLEYLTLSVINEQPTLVK